jgi:hypothetical protein
MHLRNADRSGFMNKIIDEVSGFYKIVALDPFRKTDGVLFETIPPSLMPDVSSLDIVSHEKGAFSPGQVGTVKRAWYMHPHQDDNLIVLQGTRIVEVYKPGYSSSKKITVKNRSVMVDGIELFVGPAMLVWYAGVFHRVHSEKQGSISINLAVHYDGFDLKTNFNIYDLDTSLGEYKLLREGELDQS